MKDVLRDSKISLKKSGGKKSEYAEGYVGTSLHPPRALLELMSTCTTGGLDTQMVTKLVLNILVCNPQPSFTLTLTRLILSGLLRL